MPHTARPMSGFSLEGAQPCQKMMPSVQSLGWKQHISRNCRQTSHEATVLEGWGDTHSLHRDPESKCTIQYCSREPLMGGEDKTSVKCWQHHISHHLLGLDTHFFFPDLWVLLCAATHTEKFHSNFTTSRSHFSFYPPYSCEVQLQSHNSQDTEIFSKILGCSTVLLWLHSKVPYAISMPAECHCIFFKHQGKRMPALATQVCNVLNIKLTDRTRDWDSALLELQDSP